MPDKLAQAAMFRTSIREVRASSLMAGKLTVQDISVLILITSRDTSGQSQKLLMGVSFQILSDSLYTTIRSFETMQTLLTASLNKLQVNKVQMVQPINGIPLLKA